MKEAEDGSTSPSGVDRIPAQMPILEWRRWYDSWCCELQQEGQRERPQGRDQEAGLRDARFGLAGALALDRHAARRKQVKLSHL